MAHTGPNYGKLGSLKDADYIGGTATNDNLRNKDNSWNSNGLYVVWTDGFNQRHRVTIKDKTNEVTVLFPVSGKEINWYNGPSQTHDRTGFDAICNWAQVKFFYVASDWVNNHGVRVHVKGYSNIQCRDVDWDRVKKGLDAGKTVSEIAANAGKAYSGV